jgi:thiol-disulfide isomerase/thioredoxin
MSVQPPRLPTWRWLSCVVMLSLLVVRVASGGPMAETPAASDTSPWYTVDAHGDLNVNLYFFWATTCPHCKRAMPFLTELASTYPWLRLHSLELTQHQDNVARYINMAAALGREASSVPAFLFCNDMVVGYATEATTGQLLRRKLLDCYERLKAGTVSTAGPARASPEPRRIAIPLLGAFDPTTVSLPVVTLIIAGLDAFNPCAFFVLLFLLSLLVHAHNRFRMLLIGGTFVVCSGLMYFIFMAAWLNLFLVVGQLRIMTVVAGVIALFMALMNLKDYVWFGRGVSLSIPEEAKPTLYKRMRGLVHATGLPSMMAGTVVLALMANTYELLCTAGFPMVYTRLLTLQQLPGAVYYAYLVLYNIVYMIPLGLMVLMFTITLGSRKLQAEEGRRLKLLSGLMMLNLSLVLLLAPQLLDNVVAAVGVLAAALALTGLIVMVERQLKHRQVLRTRS